MTIAQTIATLGQVFPGRFWAALSSGEALTEIIYLPPCTTSRPSQGWCLLELDEVEEGSVLVDLLGRLGSIRLRAAGPRPSLIPLAIAGYWWASRQ